MVILKCQGKLAKLLKPPYAALSIWIILVGSYIDDLITINMILESCMDFKILTFLKIMKILMS